MFFMYGLNTELQNIDPCLWLNQNKNCLQAKQREQSRLRMQAMRARKKAEKMNEEQPRMTRAAKEEQRLQWREAKAKWWAGLHPQKKSRVREQKAKRERDQRATARGNTFCLDNSSLLIFYFYPNGFGYLVIC